MTNFRPRYVAGEDFDGDLTLENIDFGTYVSKKMLVIYVFYYSSRSQSTCILNPGKTTFSNTRC